MKSRGIAEKSANSLSTNKKEEIFISACLKYTEQIRGFVISLAIRIMMTRCVLEFQRPTGNKGLQIASVRGARGSTLLAYAAHAVATC